MRRLGIFLRDRRGASAAEFALVAPLMILFLLGIIDCGRFIWSVNEAEKATQIGARWAVATDILANPSGTDGLLNYSFASQGGVEQGTTVSQTDFPGVKCTSSGGTVSCACKAACDFDPTPGTGGQAAFTALIRRMQQIYGGIDTDNVEIDYDWSGLGYAGDPNGPDVDPLVTVKTTGLGFRPIFLAGLIGFSLPKLSYTLTAEDSQGDWSN